MGTGRMKFPLLSVRMGCALNSKSPPDKFQNSFRTISLYSSNSMLVKNIFFVLFTVSWAV